MSLLRHILNSIIAMNNKSLQCILKPYMKFLMEFG